MKPLAKAIPLLQRSFAFISTTRFVAGYKPLRTDVAEERARSAALYESILRAETIAITTVKRSCSTFEVEPLDSSRERLVETLSVPEVTKRQARRVLFAESDEPLTSDAGNAHLDGTCAKSVHSPGEREYAHHRSNTASGKLSSSHKDYATVATTRVLGRHSFSGPVHSSLAELCQSLVSISHGSRADSAASEASLSRTGARPSRQDYHEVIGRIGHVSIMQYFMTRKRQSRRRHCSKR